MKRLLNNSYRRTIDNRITKIVNTHKNLSKTTTNRCRSALNIQRLNHTINMQDALYIFREKWEDLEIPISSAAEKRFVDQFFQSITNKCLKFGSFGLGPNGVRALLEVFSTQNQYVYLDLSSNKMGDDGAIYVSQFLRSNPPIIHIDLRSNAITANGFVNLFQSLKRNYFLTSLDISTVGGIERNKMGLNGCKELARLLLVNETISFLNISMSGMSIEGCTFLSEAFSKNQGLVNVDVSGNRFGTQGAIKLFSENNSLGNFEYFNISRNEITDSASHSICKQIKMSINLRTLDLSHNKFSKKFLKQLVECLQGKNIQNLMLSHNSFDFECGNIIRTLLIENDKILSLNLSSNPLHDRGLKKIAKAIDKNQTLKVLELSDTFMTDMSVLIFAERMKENNTIEKLNLNNNNIGDKGAIELVKMLCGNNTMLYIGLQSNEITDESCPAFLEMLQKNNTIIDIDIDFNDFTYRTHMNMKQSIADHKKQLNNNIAEYANRHIELLKNDEKKLIEVRHKVKKQSKLVRNSIEEKERKEQYFQDLQRKRKQDALDSDQRLANLKQEYENLHEYRLQIQNQYSDLLMKTEAEKNVADNEYQKNSIRRQQAAARVHHAESKKLETEVEINHVIDDLKLHFLTIRQQLSELIKEAHLRQTNLRKKEEQAAREEEEARKQQELREKVDKALENPPPREIKTLEEIKKSARAVPRQRKASTKKVKKAASRPKTAANAPIVRPQFNDEPI